MVLMHSRAAFGASDRLPITKVEVRFRRTPTKWAGFQFTHLNSP
jgi:hypothetical protein